MTATITPTVRISPQLWADFGLLCAGQGKTRNAYLVDMIRAVVVAERKGVLNTKGPFVIESTPGFVALERVREGGK